MTKTRAFAILLTLSLLFIPATCANAAGPHSLFVDPMANHEHHREESADDHVVMTQEELELHVLLGHMTATQADAIASGDESTPSEPVVAEKVEKNPCAGGPRLKDLPSSMAMAAANTPMTMNDLSSIELPSAESPVVSSDRAPAQLVRTPESPPPQV